MLAEPVRGGGRRDEEKGGIGLMRDRDIDLHAGQQRRDARGDLDDDQHDHQPAGAKGAAADRTRRHPDKHGRRREGEPAMDELDDDRVVEGVGDGWRHHRRARREPCIAHQRPTRKGIARVQPGGERPEH